MRGVDSGIYDTGISLKARENNKKESKGPTPTLRTREKRMLPETEIKNELLGNLAILKNLADFIKSRSTNLFVWEICFLDLLSWAN